jgi:hypothetical protein
VSSDARGTVVTGLLGLGFFAAVAVLFAMRKQRTAGYLAVDGYITLSPIHLWFWQSAVTCACRESHP